MNVIEYQKWVKTTALYRAAGTSSSEELTYLALGLIGEAGEVIDSIKKVIRKYSSLHDLGEGEEERELWLAKTEAELGDVLWYLTMIAEVAGTNLQDVMKKNVEKLEARKASASINSTVREE